MFGVLAIAGLFVAVLAYVASHPLSSEVLTLDILIPCLVLSIVFMAWVCWVLWSRWTIAKSASALAASDNPRDMIDALRTYSQSSLICTVAVKRLFDLCQDKTGGEQCRGVASRAGGAELLLTTIQSHSKNDLVCSAKSSRGALVSRGLCCCPGCRLGLPRVVCASRRTACARTGSRHIVK